jgi:hypothetical protein
MLWQDLHIETSAVQEAEDFLRAGRGRQGSQLSGFMGRVSKENFALA